MSGTAARLGLIVGFFISAQMALACDYCERKVTLNEQLATCYVGMLDDQIAQMKESNLPAQLINLGSCPGADSKTRGGGALPDATALGEKPSLSFVLDEPALRCLAVRLKDETWSPELIKTFEVRRDCETQ